MTQKGAANSPRLFVFDKDIGDKLFYEKVSNFVEFL